MKPQCYVYMYKEYIYMYYHLREHLWNIQYIDPTSTQTS